MSISHLYRRIERLENRVKAAERNGPRAEELKKMVREATRDPFTWVTRYAKTYNEHWVEEGRPDPYEFFPPYPYFQSYSKPRRKTRSSS